ncbi:MAG: OmpH family outer membrane protein [Gammaproteobacteria bacterium]|nr:OmpH family outer membrane protein [Gammaproteobacteria bacterium]
MLKRSIFILAAVVAAAQSSVALAEMKIGVYDNRRILESLPIVQTELQKLKSEFEPKEKEISDLQNKLLKLKEDIEKNAPVLSASDLQSKQLEYQSKRRELQLLAEDTERVFKVRQNEVVRSIQTTVDQEVLKLAKEEAYDLILRSGVVHASASVDITPKILKRLSEK